MQSKLSVCQIFELLYYWSKKAGVEETAHEVEVNKNTVTFRDACRGWVEILNSNKIGGRGKTVEVDETLMSKKKNYKGKELPEIWVVGGICRETDECFAEVAEDRTAETLEELLQCNIKKGTNINT